MVQNNRRLYGREGNAGQRQAAPDRATLSGHGQVSVPPAYQSSTVQGHRGRSGTSAGSASLSGPNSPHEGPPDLFALSNISEAFVTRDEDLLSPNRDFVTLNQHIWNLRTLDQQSEACRKRTCSAKKPCRKCRRWCRPRPVNVTAYRKWRQEERGTERDMRDFLASPEGEQEENAFMRKAQAFYLEVAKARDQRAKQQSPSWYAEGIPHDSVHHVSHIGWSGTQGPPHGMKDHNRAIAEPWFSTPLTPPSGFSAVRGHQRHGGDVKEYCSPGDGKIGICGQCVDRPLYGYLCTGCRRWRENYTDVPAYRTYVGNQPGVEFLHASPSGEVRRDAYLRMRHNEFMDELWRKCDLHRRKYKQPYRGEGQALPSIQQREGIRRRKSV